MTPLNKYHTHEDIIHRKKRVAKNRKNDEEKEYSDVDYLLVQSEKKETSEDEDAAIFCVAYDN